MDLRKTEEDAETFLITLILKKVLGPLQKGNCVFRKTQRTQWVHSDDDDGNGDEDDEEAEDGGDEDEDKDGGDDEEEKDDDVAIVMMMKMMTMIMMMMIFITSALCEVGTCKNAHTHFLGTLEVPEKKRWCQEGVSCLSAT